MDSESQYEVVWTPAPAVDAEADLPARYEPARDVGDGFFGPVIGARDQLDSGQLVRVEIVPARVSAAEGFDAAFEAATALARRVVSANVARLREVGRLSDGRWFIVSEWIEGESFHALLRREGTLHPRHALEIARQVCFGLESAHALGLAHGSVGPASVWLASGTAKSDQDPHGVAVRLVDFGFANALAPQTPPGLRDDLRAVRALLAMAVRGNAGLDLGAAAMRLAADETESADSATRLRESIEELLRSAPELRENSPPAKPIPAPRAEPRVEPRVVERPPRWLLPAGVGLAALACAGFGLWIAARGEADERARDLAGARDDVARLEGERKESAEQLSNSQNAQRELAERLAASETGAKTAANEAQAQTGELRARLDVLGREIDEQARLAEQAKARAAAAEARAKELEASHRPEARTAAAFDAALAAVAERRWGDASRMFAALEIGGEAMPAACRELGRACASVERVSRARASASFDAVEFDAAGESLTRAETAVGDLEREAAAWIGEGSGAASREQKFRSAIADLRGELAIASAGAAEIDETQWRELGEGVVRDPRPAFEHAAKFGCDHLDGLAQRFAAELRGWVLDGEALDVGRLASFDQLPLWLAQMGAGNVEFPERTAADLELLDFARRWHDADPKNDQAPDWKRFQIAPIVAARRDWRNELRLQWQLAQPGGGYPIRDGGVLVYRCVDPSGRVEYWRETALESSPNAWRVRRERLAADGIAAVGEGVLRIEKHGAEFELTGSSVPLLDLRAWGVSVLVAPPPPSFDGELPTGLGLEEKRLEYFRTNRNPCLVSSTDDLRRWFDPRWGMVREETRTERGWIHRELVYAR